MTNARRESSTDRVVVRLIAARRELENGPIAKKSAFGSWARSCHSSADRDQGEGTPRHETFATGVRLPFGVAFFRLSSRTNDA